MSHTTNLQLSLLSLKSNRFPYLQFVYTMKPLEPDRFLEKGKLLSLQAICIVFTHLIRL